jgi:branched-chain amino acid transport system permease protein
MNVDTQKLGGAARVFRSATAAASPSPSGRWNKVAIIALVVASLCVPFVFESFRVLQLAGALVWITAAASLNLLSGYAGILSVGTGAFVGMGAYISAIVREQYGWTFPLSVLIAGAACFAIGAVVGLPALRLRGLYLALVTLGLASCLPLLLKRLDGLTGGAQGFAVDPLPAAAGLASDQVTYLSAWIVCALVLTSMSALVTGPAGRALKGVRDNELVAASFGVNPAVVKTLTFGISSLMAGMAGACYVAVVGYVAPDAFTLHLSVLILIACVVGGLRTVFGAVVAGLFVVYVPIFIGEVAAQSFADVAYGVLVIGFLLIAPGGVAGEIGRRRLNRRLATSVPAAGSSGAAPLGTNKETRT